MFITFYWHILLAQDMFIYFYTKNELDKFISPKKFAATKITILINLNYTRVYVDYYNFDTIAL